MENMPIRMVTSYVVFVKVGVLLVQVLHKVFDIDTCIHTKRSIFSQSSAALNTECFISPISGHKHFINRPYFMDTSYFI